MTDEEVELIYNYLHENYEYVDGELIVKKNRNNAYKKGHVLGDVRIRYVGRSYMATTVCVGGVSYSYALSKFIYLYFNKTLPRFIKYVNGNSMDTRIENIRPLKEVSEILTYESRIKKPRGFSVDKKCGRYIVQSLFKNKMVYVGAYKDKKEAHDAYVYLDHLLRNELTPPDEAIEKTLSKYPRPLKNKTGWAGIHQVGNKYVAKFKNKQIGRFDTPEEAHEAYLKARAEHANP